MRPDATTLIRGAYEALNEGRLEEWGADNLPPNFELVPMANSLQAEVRFTGPDGVARFFADLTQVWERVHLELEELVDFGDRVVALGRVQNRGRGSGMDLDVVAAHLWSVHENVPVRVELIGDRDEALRRGRAESSR